MKLNVSDIASSLHYDKEKLLKAIERFGREEIVSRLCWHNATNDRATIDKLITDFLNGDWVDHQGTPQGKYFWGEL
jgi:hypothetical protein